MSSRVLRQNLNIKCFNIGKQVILKWIVNIAFLETMFFLSIIQSECLSFLDYAQGMAKFGIGLMNADKQETFNAILCIGKLLEGPLTNPYVNFNFVVSCNHKGTSSPEQLMNLMPIVRNHTDLDNITTKKKEQKIRRNPKVSILVNVYVLIKTKIKKQMTLSLKVWLTQIRV